MALTKKSITGFENSEISTRKLNVSGPFIHAGKTIVIGSSSDLSDNKDVVGPVVVGEDLVFYYKTATGVKKSHTVTGVNI